MNEGEKHIFGALPNHIAGGHHDLKYYNFPFYQLLNTKHFQAI